MNQTTEQTQNVPLVVPDSLVRAVARNCGMEAGDLDIGGFKKTLMRTVIKDDRASGEQVAAFLMVAKEYNLNPITKEIYAFPDKSGGIQPIVSVDGWLKIINSHPSFNGMEFEDKLDDQRKIISITCRMYRKDRDHPVVVTEYMDECARNTEPWKKWPARMLRHKAAIQAARYAFGFSGIMEPDEYERGVDAGMGQTRDVTPEPTCYPEDQFDQNFDSWRKVIEAGKKSADQIIATVETKGKLTDQQKQKIRDCEAIEGEVQ